MIGVFQNVHDATLTVKNEVVSEIKKGLVVFVGVHKNDSFKDIEIMAKKIANTRMFTDTNDKINESLLNFNGEVMLVSNFTLCGDMSHGNRPNFSNASSYEIGLEMFNKLVELTKSYGLKVVTGMFGEHMNINQNLNGPINLIFNTFDVLK